MKGPIKGMKGQILSLNGLKGGGGQTDGRNDRQTEVPLRSIGPRPLRDCCPKTKIYRHYASLAYSSNSQVGLTVGKDAVQNVVIYGKATDLSFFFVEI